MTPVHPVTWDHEVTWLIQVLVQEVARKLTLLGGTRA